MISFAEDNHDILIASCGQDMFIRVWRLSKELTSDPTPDGKDELKVKKNSFTVSLQGKLMIHYYSSV